MAGLGGLLSQSWFVWDTRCRRGEVPAPGSVVRSFVVISGAETRTYTMRAILNEGSKILSIMDLSISHMLSQILNKTTLRDTTLTGMKAEFLESIWERLCGECLPEAGNLHVRGVGGL